MDAVTTSSDVAAAVRDRLDGAGLAYEVVECDPELADTAQFCERYGYSLSESANAILVAEKRKDEVAPALVACVVLADHRLDVNRTVRKRMGVRKVSFAAPELTVERTGMMIGGVTPVGLPDTVPVWVDAAVMEPERIIIGSGDRSSKLLLSPTALVALGADVVDGLAQPTDP